MSLKRFRLSFFLAILLVMTANMAMSYVLSGRRWAPASVIYDKHTLSSSWSTATSKGSSQWNFSPSLFEWASGDYGDNDVYLDTLDKAGNRLAVTTTNWNSKNMIYKMTVKFDKEESWYTGTGTPSSTQVDAWSAAAHEFGHGLGLADVSASSTACTGSESSRPTMCGSYSKGKTYFRSLAQDDKNGALKLYSTLYAQAPMKSQEEESINIEVEFLYEKLSFSQRIRRSDAIFTGLITHVSETQWNQDSGEYWEDYSADGTTLYTALPVHFVELSLVESIDSKVQVGRNVRLTILGNSPVDSPKPEHKLQVGNEVIVFARQTEIVWRDGVRSVLELMSVPRESYLLRREDGRYAFSNPAAMSPLTLEDLTERVRGIRHPEK